MTTYEATVTAVPYASRVVPHLVRYLVDKLADAVESHALVIGMDNEVDEGPDFDSITVTLRYAADTDAQAEEIAQDAASAIHDDDPHWRVTGNSAARRTDS